MFTTTMRRAAVAVLAATALLSTPSTASAKPCVGDVCVPDASRVLDQFCAIADGPIVEIICSLG